MILTLYHKAIQNIKWEGNIVKLHSCLQEVIRSYIIFHYPFENEVNNKNHYCDNNLASRDKTCMQYLNKQQISILHIIEQ